MHKSAGPSVTLLRHGISETMHLADKASFHLLALSFNVVMQVWIRKY